MTDEMDGHSTAASVGDGKNIARKRVASAWELLALRALRPVEGPVRATALNSVVDLVGFYVAWHLFGGFEGLRALGMQRSMIYRKVKLFRESFGEHPDEYKFPGLAITPEDYLAAALLPDAVLPYVLVGDERGLPARLP